MTETSLEIKCAALKARARERCWRCSADVSWRVNKYWIDENNDVVAKRPPDEPHTCYGDIKAARDVAMAAVRAHTFNVRAESVYGTAESWMKAELDRLLAESEAKNG